MSISSAPASTARRVSSSLTCRDDMPLGNAVATEQTLMSAAFDRLFRNTDHRRVNADGRDVRQSRHRVVQVNRLLAQLPDLSRRVLALERRQVDHAEHELERLHLRRFLDGSALESRDALVHADFVDGRHPGQVRQGAGCFDGSKAHGQIRGLVSRCRSCAAAVRRPLFRVRP